MHARYSLNVIARYSLNVIAYMYLACIQLRNTIPVVVGYVRLLACMWRYALHHAVQQLLR